MNNTLRRQVLSCFKQLHKTRKNVFAGDRNGLEKARLKINEEFKSKKHVTDSSVITELINFSKEIEKELKTTVIQAREVEPGKYELRITKDTVKLDRVPYKECSKSSTS